MVAYPAPPPKLNNQAWADPESQMVMSTSSGGSKKFNFLRKRSFASSNSSQRQRSSLLLPFQVVAQPAPWNSGAELSAPGPNATKMNNILENGVVQVVTLGLTVVLLFGGDLVVAVCNVGADQDWAVLLCICLVVFSVEWFCNIAASAAQTPRYSFSLFFFLDFIALVSVLIDIVVLSANNLNNSGPLARAARAARIGTRAGRSIRLMRLMRFLRLVRITRLAKLLLARRLVSRGVKNLQESDHAWIDRRSASAMTRAETLGAQIGAAMTKKVIIMTLMLLMMISVLERSNEFQRCGGEMVASLEMYYKTARIGQNCTKLQQEAGSWFQGDTGIGKWSQREDQGLTKNGLFLAIVENCELYSDPKLVGPSNVDPSMTYLAHLRRGTEIQAIPCEAEFAVTDDDSQQNRSATYLLYDLRSEVVEEAKYSLGFTLVVVVSLLGFSIIFSNDTEGIANQLVLPIQQLMEDMSRTAKLEFDKVTPLDGVIPSTVFEVRSLQTAFHNLNAAVRSFSKFTPLEVVRHFLSLGAVAQLGVVKRNVSIFFSDIEGWTTICEGTPPAQVLALLSEYFESMVSIILEEQGTMLEFVGDAILAIWNAPNDVPDHAVRSLTAAWRMDKVLKELRAAWASQGKPEISIRVGLHSGYVWVGNLGSNLRMKYGVLGNGVNLASRLEEMNKRYKTMTMISEDVLREPGVSETFLVRPLDMVEVVGRTEPTRIYDVLGPRSEADEDTRQVAEVSAEAMTAYLNRNFEQAIERLQVVAELKGGSDPAGEVLMERCKAFLETPPPPKWDGLEVTK